jgi:hypothetical protein
MKSSPEEMQALMQPTELNFQIDDDGDARCVIGGLGSLKDRTHLVIVNAQVHEWDAYKDRDVWAMVAKLDGIPQSFELMLKLLRLVGRKKGGSLIASTESLIYRFDVPLTASAEHLRDTVFLCASIADELEQALTTGDEF